MFGCPAEPPRNCPEAMQAAASFLIRWLPLMAENPSAERKALLNTEAAELTILARAWVRFELGQRGGGGGGRSAAT